MKPRKKGAISKPLSLYPLTTEQALSAFMQIEPKEMASENNVVKGDVAMSEHIRKAVKQGNLKIGGREMSCAVLDDGTRIISRNAIFRAFGRTKRGRKKDEIRVLNMPSFIDANNLQPFISEDLRGVLNQIEYHGLKGQHMTGYDARILPLICDVYLIAREEKKLTKSQFPLALASEILVRSFAKVGIIALVDEATGYQEIRASDALQKILEAFIAKELRPWIKTFPDSYYEQLFRLRGWQFQSIKRRPQLVGKITNDLIYQRLAPGVLAELKAITPRDEKGRPKHRYHQRLTENTGHPKLKEHLASVVALMRAAKTWPGFLRLINRALPAHGRNLELPLPEEEGEETKE